MIPARDGYRCIVIAAALGALSSMPVVANASCATAAASTSAASAAIVEAATSNPDTVGGLMTCIWPLMNRQTFQAAMVDASARIGNEPLAMLVIELGSGLLSAEIVIEPDPTLTEPPASGS